MDLVKVCLTLTPIENIYQIPSKMMKKKTSTMGFTQKEYGSSSQRSINRSLPKHFIQTVGLSNRLPTYNSSKPHCYLYKHNIPKDNQQQMFDTNKKRKGDRQIKAKKKRNIDKQSQIIMPMTSTNVTNHNFKTKRKLFIKISIEEETYHPPTVIF